MKVVFLAPFAYAPKATVSARMMPMASALARRGHRVTVLIPPYDNPSDSERRWEQDGVQYVNMRLAHTATRYKVAGEAQGARNPIPSHIVSLALQMARHVRDLQPDVVHVFKPIGPSALAMWLLHARGMRRFVVDNDDWEGRGGWLDVNPYPGWQKLIMSWQERWSLTHARAVTCASSVLVERTRDMTGGRVGCVGRIPVILLPNGPDNALRAVVARAEAQRDHLRLRFGWLAGPVVIYAGTVPLNHDLDIAVSALRRAIASHPSLRWVLIATGDGLASLEASIRQAGIGVHVQRCGFMPHDELVERLVAADVAIYPYRDSNINRAKCSGKVIDYMACGKPMVVSDVGMNGVYIQHGRNGLLTPPGDAEAFGAALINLLDHPTFASLLGRVAQQTLWSRFGWDGRIVELENLYGAVQPPQAKGGGGGGGDVVMDHSSSQSAPPSSP